MKANYDLSPLAQFIEQDTTPVELAKVIDEIMYDYVQLLLECPSFAMGNLSDHLYYLRRLRDFFNEAKKTEKELQKMQLCES